MVIVVASGAAVVAGAAAGEARAAVDDVGAAGVLVRAPGGPVGLLATCVGGSGAALVGTPPDESLHPTSARSTSSSRSLGMIFMLLGTFEFLTSLPAA